MADRYYTTGGTLSLDAPSYVEREADRALLKGLYRGDYCYILTSRQMGKSSLMIRTASKLRVEEATRVAVLDLAAIGQNLNPEQWYDGMLLRLGRQLGLEDEFDDFWLDHPRLGPVQRFFEAVYQIALAQTKGRLVIFVDELDTVRSLPFSSDEFFAAIRQCYNERSSDSEWGRLTFCLLGVATPSDLIQDPHISPFNIGRRIVLEDFKKDEVAKLVEGLEAREKGEFLLDRIFAWTNGHPYLTQRLCRAVADQNRSSELKTIAQPGAVDGICHRLFLSNRAKERDDNLLFVRERLLRSDHDRAAVLHMYRKVRTGGAVVDDETNPIIGTLHLSGVTQIDRGQLKVRNRIYWHVFNPSWVEATMPDAEKRRQQEAYRRGVFRTTVLSLVVLAVMLYLAITAFVQSQRAQARLIALNTDHGAKLLAEGENYDALAWFAENLKLSKKGSVPDQLGRKRFAAVLRQSPRLVEILPHEASVRHLAFSPDGTFILTASDDQLARVWELESGKLKFAPLAHGSSVLYGAFSPDGSRFVTASSDQTARLYDLTNGSRVGELMRHDYAIVQAVFSPNGRWVATGSLDDTARVWDAETGKAVGDPLRHRYAVNRVAFSPDSRMVVTAARDGTARVWPFLSQPQESALLLEHSGGVEEAVFSPDGRLVASGTDQGEFHLWMLTGKAVGDRVEHSKVFSLRHPLGVHSIDFSPDGRSLATGCADGLVRILDVEQRQVLAAPLVHQEPVVSVEFSPNGDFLLSVTLGNEARVWDVASGRAASPPFRHLDHIYHAGFGADGRRVATAGADKMVKVWDLAGQTATSNQWKESSETTALAYSPDGDYLACGTRQGEVLVRQRLSGEPIANVPLDHGGEVLFLRFSDDSDRLLSTGFLGRAKLWDLASGTLLHEFVHRDAIRFACFNRFGNRLITVSRDRAATIWNLETGAPVAPPVEHPYRVVNAAFSAGGREFVTASADNSVYVWSALSGKLVRGPFRTGFSLGRPAFDARGERFAALTAADSARVFSLGDGHPVSEVMMHRAAIRCLSFDQRGGRVLTTSDDHTARIWDAWKGNPVSPPLRHRGSVTFGAFSEDDQQMVTVGDDQTVRLWSVPNGAPLSPPMRHEQPVNLATLSSQSNELLTASGSKVFQWNLEPERRPRDVLVREAELLSGKNRDVTGELMEMSSTNLVESWSLLVEAHPELFSVDIEQRIGWHHTGLRSALDRQAYQSAGFHASILKRLSEANTAYRSEIEPLLLPMMEAPAYPRMGGRVEPAGFEALYQSRVPIRVAPRDPEAKAGLVDLSPSYNGLLEDSWLYTQVGSDDLSLMLPGVRELGGVEYDVRGVVQVASAKLNLNSKRRFPVAVEAIDVGQRGRRLHLLHSAVYPSGDGEVVGSYRLRFADGSELVRELVYGADVADWRQSAQADGVARLNIVHRQGTAAGREVRLFSMMIPFPSPDSELLSVDLIGGERDSAPFLVALTVE